MLLATCVSGGAVKMDKSLARRGHRHNDCNRMTRRQRERERDELVQNKFRIKTQFESGGLYCEIMQFVFTSCSSYNPMLSPHKAPPSLCAVASVPGAGGACAPSGVASLAAIGLNKNVF